MCCRARDWKLRRRVGWQFRGSGEISATAWGRPALIGTMIARNGVAANLRSMLFVAVAWFGLRLAFYALWRGVLGQNLESVVSPGRRLISPDLVSPVDLVIFAVPGLLARNRFRQILARQLYLVWYGIRHDRQLLQWLLDLLGVLRCHVGCLCLRWNNRDCV